MTPLQNYLSTLPKPHKWLMIIIAIVGLLILLLSAFGGGSLWMKHRKDAQYEAREAKREEERKALEEAAATNKADMERHKQAGLAKDAEIKERDLIIAAFGKRGEELKKVADEEDKKLVDEMQSINADIDPVERCKRLCAKFRLKPSECGCE